MKELVPRDGTRCMKELVQRQVRKNWYQDMVPKGVTELVPRYGTGAMKEWYREIVQVIKELVPRDGTRGYNRIGTKEMVQGYHRIGTKGRYEKIGTMRWCQRV